MNSVSLLEYKRGEIFVLITGSNKNVDMDVTAKSFSFFVSIFELHCLDDIFVV